eukprot:SAG22_NODE_208_length_15237_cov_22.602774_6_plen_1481_part_00
MKADREVVLAAVAQDGNALEHAAEGMRADREVVLAAVAQLAAVAKGGNALEDAAEFLKADREVVLAAVAQSGNALEDAAEFLKADREVVLVAVAQSGKALAYAAEFLKADREVVLAAVAQSGEALAYAAEGMRADREVVLAAVAQDGEALAYAAEFLRADREVVLAAVAQDGEALEDAAAGLKADREVVLVAVAQNGEALAYAAEFLRADREVVLAAVAQDGEALAYAAEFLRADREVVLAAVAQSGEALAYAAEFLRADREVVLAAVAQDGGVLDWAASDLQADPTFQRLNNLTEHDRTLPHELLRLGLHGCLQHVPAMLAEGITAEELPALTASRLEALGLGEADRAAFLAVVSAAAPSDGTAGGGGSESTGRWRSGSRRSTTTSVTTPRIGASAAELQISADGVFPAQFIVTCQNERCFDQRQRPTRMKTPTACRELTCYNCKNKIKAGGYINGRPQNELKNDGGESTGGGARDVVESQSGGGESSGGGPRQSATPLAARIEVLAGRDQAAFFKKLLRQGTRKLHKCKIVVLGSGTVGKTSLIKRLRDMPFDPLQDSTCGIDAYQVEAVSWKPRQGGSIDGDEDAKVLFGGVAKELARAEKEEEEKRARAKAAAEAAAASAAASAATSAKASVAVTYDQEFPDLPSETAATKTSAAAAEQPPPKRARPSSDTHSGGGFAFKSPAAASQAVVAPKPAPGASVSQPSLLQQRSSLSGTAFMEKVAAAAADSAGEQQQEDDDSPTAVVLDFAGQRMYYTQHHCELSDDLTLYVVAWSLDVESTELLGGEDEHAEMSHLENLIYWLNSIHAQAPNAPVLVVATKSDLVDDSTRDRRVQQIQDAFAGAAFEDQIVKFQGSDTICTSSLHDEDAGVAALREAVAVQLKPRDAESFTGMKGFGEEVPLKWYNFLRLIREQQAAGKKRLPLDECRLIATNDCGFGEDDRGEKDRELLLMLKVFTDLGLLKHATLMNLESVVVLDLQWIVDLMTELLCRRSIEKKVEKTTRGRRVSWRRFRDTGRLEMQLLPEVWPELEESERQIMLNYATEHGLCCKLPPECGEQGLYVVPSILPPRTAAAAEDSWAALQPDDVEFRFACIHLDGEWGEATGFLPDSLYFRLVANLLQDAQDVKDAFRHLSRDRAEIDGREHYMIQLEKQRMVQLEEQRTDQLPAVRVVVRRGKTEQAASRVADRIRRQLAVLADTRMRDHFRVKFRLEVRWADHAGAAEDWHWAEWVGKRDADAVAWLLPIASSESGAAAAKGAAVGQGAKRPLADAAGGPAPKAARSGGGAAGAAAASAAATASPAKVAHINPGPTAAAPTAKAARVTINAPGQWDFFLSHTQRDGQAVATAEAVFSGMAELGHSCWLDVRVGSCDVAAMEEGVRNSEFFLAIVTDNGTDSYFSRSMCRQEMGWALDAGKKIVPLHQPRDKDNIAKFIAEAATHGFDLGKHNFVPFDRAGPRFRQASLKTILDQVGIPVARSD